MIYVFYDCFCEGLPVLEGALTKMMGKRVSVREVKCNVHGDEYCKYDVRY
ncbi:V4R domain-containing protein [Paenibacillus sp. CMAA1364]